MPDLRAHLQTMASYNAWANQRVYAAAATLPDAAYRQSTGVFFGRLHGTLNHLLVADRIWMHRLTGDGDAPSRLDAILFEQLAPLRAAREAEDRRISDYVASLSVADLDASFDYKNTRGQPYSQPRWQVLVHLFNHRRWWTSPGGTQWARQGGRGEPESGLELAPRHLGDSHLLASASERIDHGVGSSVPVGAFIRCPRDRSRSAPSGCRYFRNHPRRRLADSATNR